MANSLLVGWAGDAYTNWLTQNAINAPIRLLSNLTGNTINMGNVATSSINTRKEEKIIDSQAQVMNQKANLGYAQVGANISLSILNEIGAYKEAKLLPNISHGGNTGDVDFANNDLNFTFRWMRCKDEFMRQIDNYFTMFGYKINEIKIPNIIGRENFNYIQISEADDLGYGNIPSVALKAINDIARRGVTIWHNHANLGDYTVPNTIVT